LLNLAYQGKMYQTCPKLKTVNWYVTTPRKNCERELCHPVRRYNLKTLRKILLRASLNQSTSEKKTKTNSDKKFKVTSTDRKLSVSEKRCKGKFSRISAQKTALHNVSQSTALEGDVDCEIKLEQLKIYRGKVQNITIFGCFVQLHGFRSNVEGLVHISQLRREGKVTNVEEVVARGDTVWVKVLFNRGRKTSLSMKDVDQTTGEDLNPIANKVVRNIREGDIRMMLHERPVDLMDTLPARVMLVLDEDELKTKNEETIISSSVKCDLEQMIKANVIDKSELPDFDEQAGLMHKVKMVVVLEMVPLT
jgi:predicted RNA-binding protein with RPS1 domain